MESTPQSPPKKIFRLTIGRFSIITGFLVGVTSLTQDVSFMAAIALGLVSTWGTMAMGYLGTVGFTLVSKTLRFGVRTAKVMARRAGVDGLSPEAVEIIAARGLPTEFAVRFLPDRGWSTAISRFVEYSVLSSISICALTATLLSLCCLVFSVFSTALDSMLFVPWLIGSAFFLYVSNRGLTDFMQPHLGAFAAAALAEAAQGRTADALQTGASGELSLPGTGKVALRIPETEHTVLELCVPIWKEHVDIRLVAQDTVEREKGDVNLGVERFDRSTIFLHEAPVSTLPDAWLTPEIQTVMLVLFSKGAEVEAGEMVFRVPLLTGFGRIPAALPFLGALSVLVAEQRGSSERERVHRALQRRDEAWRQVMLDRLSDLDSTPAADAIRVRWAQAGEGPSRLYAVGPLEGPARAECLAAIANDARATPRLQGRALAQWARCGDRSATKVRGRITKITKEDNPLGVETLLGFGTEYALSLAEDGPRIPDVFWPSVALRGVSGAAIAHLRILGEPTLDAAVIQRMRDAILAPLHTLPTESAAHFRHWEVYADVLTQLSRRALPTPLDHEIRTARAEVRSQLKIMAQSHVGGLSVRAHGDDGGLSITPDQNSQDLALAEPVEGMPDEGG